MSWTRWKIGLLSLFSLLSLESWFSQTVVAQCIQADIAVQYNISGSQEPTERTNDVDFQSHAACRGNASVTTSVQGNEGGNGRVRQTRVVRHRFKPQSSLSQAHNGILGSSTVQIQSNPAIDVYNAAENLNQ